MAPHVATGVASAHGTTHRRGAAPGHRRPGGGRHRRVRRHRAARGIRVRWPRHGPAAPVRARRGPDRRGLRRIARGGVAAEARGRRDRSPSPTPSPPDCSRSGSCRAARRHAGCPRRSCCSRAAGSSRSGIGAPFARARRVAPRTCTSSSTGTIRWPWGGTTSRVTPRMTRCSRCCRPALRAVRSRSGAAPSVAVDRVVKDNGRLLAVTGNGFRNAAEWYREPRPVTAVPGRHDRRRARGRARGHHPRLPRRRDDLDRVERDRHRGAVARVARAPAALDPAERGRTATPRAGERVAGGRRGHGCRERGSGPAPPAVGGAVRRGIRDSTVREVAEQSVLRRPGTARRSRSRRTAWPRASPSWRPSWRSRFAWPAASCNGARTPGSACR